VPRIFPYNPGLILEFPRFLDGPFPWTTDPDSPYVSLNYAHTYYKMRFHRGYRLVIMDSPRLADPDYLPVFEFVALLKAYRGNNNIRACAFASDGEHCWAIGHALVPKKPIFNPARTMGLSRVTKELVQQEIRKWLNGSH
jgi:hypothetical protein